MFLNFEVSHGAGDMKEFLSVSSTVERNREQAEEQECRVGLAKGRKVISIILCSLKYQVYGNKRDGI